jgi:hypothetical protein
MKSSYKESKYSLLREDAFCGSIAGLLSGMVVAPFEYSKGN